jgi:eukaryotic-like serine/threonine-protein kinase
MGDPKRKTARAYRTVGRYRVYSELASGGMATVHLGCLLGSAGFSKLVAIKALHEQFALESEFVSMFLDEARLASTIHHPNVVASLDVVAEQGELLVIMEYVHGETLAGLLRLSRQERELPPVPVVVRVICDALEGLHAAHTASLAGYGLNIVHRDVSPQNIMVGADGNARVLDFGIAQAALRSRVTAAGTVKGKVAYMSPEQVQGRPVDARTDVFAAGVVLWEALTGRRLFFAPDSRDAVGLLLNAPIPPPSSVVPTLPKALDDVVLRALARDIDARFATAHDFAEALRNVSGEGSRREVADWVGRVAKDNLAQRLEMLQALEASAIHTQVSLQVPAAAGSSPYAAPLPDGTHTQATTSTEVLPQSPPEPLPRNRAPWLFAAGGVLTALLVWLFAGSSRPPQAAPSAAASVAPAITTPAAAVASVAPPLQRERDLPVIAAESMALVPVPSSEAAEAEAPEADTPTTGVQKMASKKVPAQVAAAPQAATPRHKSCNPPYRIDAAGVRRVKPECL